MKLISVPPWLVAPCGHEPSSVRGGTAVCAQLLVSEWLLPRCSRLVSCHLRANGPHCLHSYALFDGLIPKPWQGLQVSPSMDHMKLSTSGSVDSVSSMEASFSDPDSHHFGSSALGGRRNSGLLPR